MYPSSQRRSEFWPSSAGPVASRPPLVIGLLQRLRGDLFHLGVFMRWSSMHGGLLAALPEVGLLGMGCWYIFRVPQILCLTPLPGGVVVASVFGVAVRALLRATSLPLGLDVSPAPGQSLSSLPFKDCNSVLKVLVLKCRVLTFS